MKASNIRTKLYAAAFAVIVIAKLLAMGLCSSDYEQRMFFPFVQTFLSGTNPYEYFYQNSLVASFPYPPLMLLIESIFGWLSAQAGGLFLSRLLFKVPLLILDILGMYYLRHLCSSRRKYLLVLYFASPIVFFASYMHGQLDIIPTVFLIASLFYLTRNRAAYDIHIAAILLGCALATKLHILAAVPILLLYIEKKEGVGKAALFGLEAAVVLCAFILPFWCEGFFYTVLLNKEQFTLMDVVLDYGSAQLMIVLVVICAIYLKVFQLNYINRELLLSILGVMFSVFLMCISPMPGWFVWIVPFVFIYFTSVYDNKYKMLAIYGMFNAAYLVYFLLFHKTGYVTLYVGNYSMEFLKMDSSNLSNVVFSLMTAMLLVIIWNMYQYGMAANKLYKRSSTPFTIGIAGDSGTGKSELLAKLDNTFGRKRILHIEGDGDHRWERGSSDWEKYTHLDPRANFLYRQAEDISILRAGSMVCRVDYDHKTGKFTEQKRIRPKPYIILCGLHSLFLPKSREALDMKIYMDTDETLRRLWKIQRDTGSRGYSGEKIIEQIEKRIPDARKYIYPQKEYADLTISYFDPTLDSCFDVEHKIKLCLRLTMSISVNTEELINELRALGIAVALEYNADITKQTLTVDLRDAEPTPNQFNEIAARLIPNYKEIFESNILWEDGMDGVLQLIILKIIGEIMKGF